MTNEVLDQLTANTVLSRNKTIPAEIVELAKQAIAAERSRIVSWLREKSTREPLDKWAALMDAADEIEGGNT